MPQVQCPNCGGYRVNSYEEEHVDPRTGRAVEPRGCAFPIFKTAGLLVAAFFGLIGAVGFDILLGTMPLLTIAVVALSFFMIGKEILGELRKPLAENLITHWGHSCVLCGYEWSEGQPHNPTTVRPDLIQRGAQKIEEEQDAWDDIE